jgi:hypothetical protein
MSKQTEFEKWIKEYYTYSKLEEPPKDWNPEEEMYYLINGRNYGPIKWKDIPKKFVEG